MAQDNFANQGQQFAAKAADFSRAVLKIVSEVLDLLITIFRLFSEGPIKYLLQARQPR